MDFEKTLIFLLDHEIDFVVIGGVAMYAQGSAVLTRDLNICYNRARANVERMTEVLETIHPRLRGVPEGLPFRLDAETVLKGLNFTLITDYGNLDLLGEVAGIGDYQAARASSDEGELFGRRCLVLSVEALIRAKRAAGRPRDLAAIPELEALQELKRKLKDPGRRET
jgi:hypothetical protein